MQHFTARDSGAALLTRRQRHENEAKFWAVGRNKLRARCTQGTATAGWEAVASAGARIPPPNVNPSPCGLVVDRHVPKTAGTTVRSFLRRNQQLGNCEYLGYDVGRTWQSRVGFSHKSLTELKRNLIGHP